MKKHLFSVSILSWALLSVAYSQSVAQIDPGLTLQGDKPEAGSVVRFTYTSKGGKLAGTDTLTAAFFYYTANKWSGHYAEDIPLVHDSGESWSGSFTLPDTAGAFAFRFKARDSVDDNHGLGYISLVYRQGQVVPGAYAAAALLNYQSAWVLGLPEHSDTALPLFEMELRLHPEKRSRLELAYYKLLDDVKQEDALPQIEERLKVFQNNPDPTIDDYRLAIELYEFTGRQEPVDSLYRLCSKRFPASTIAMRAMENKFGDAETVDSQLVYYAAFEKAFAGDTTGTAADDLAYFSADIAKSYMAKNNYRLALDFIARVNKKNFNSYKALLYQTLAETILKNPSPATLELADSVMVLGLGILDAHLQHPEIYKFPNVPLSDWNAQIRGLEVPAFSNTYAKVLSKKGDFEKSLRFQGKALAVMADQDPDFNQLYVENLLKNGYRERAKEASEKFLRAGKATDHIRFLYRQEYIRERGSDAGFNVLLASLEKVALEKFHQDVLKGKIDEAAKMFALKDMKGRVVSLSHLKGKVVILDFWATWCGPCKASFPGMQKAVNNFKNDSNVVFLFVNSLEGLSEKDRIKQISEFMKMKNYSFRVLLDTQVIPEGKKYKVIESYGVNGIPTKFVINGKGRIVFRAVGFDGGEEKLVAEISEMIRIAKG